MSEGASTVPAVSEQPEDRAVYVRCEPPIAVEVEQDGEWWPGSALAYWGQQVTARWTVAVGMTFQQTVDAGRVRRT